MCQDRKDRSTEPPDGMKEPADRPRPAPFDYTKWQTRLWLDKSVEELSREAMRLRAANKER